MFRSSVAGLAVTATLLLPSLANAYTLGAAFVGCVDTLAANSQTVTGVDVVTCTDTCRTGGFKYAIHNPTTSTCACSQNSPTGDRNLADSPDFQGTATCNNYYSRKIDTSFKFSQCGRGYNNNGVLTGYTQVTNADECFTQCAGYAGARLAPYFNTNYCYCTDRTYAPSQRYKCASSGSEATYFVYFHDEDAQASLVARRRRREAAVQGRMKSEMYCPQGLQACNVDQTASAFECLDVTTEMESCGGCRYGVYNGNATTSGTDCSNLAGTPSNAVTCFEGRCKAFACKKGWTLLNGFCEKV